jgi:hypothetical protein
MQTAAKLVVVVADGTYEAVLKELFARSRDAGFRQLESRIVPDTYHDSSRKLTELLRPFLREYNHALVLRDLSGSGHEDKGARKLEEHLEGQMRGNGWLNKKYAAIVTEPEIEEWLRLPSPSMLELLEERARKHRDSVKTFQRVLDDLLKTHGGRDERGKACKPKEVFEKLVRHYGIPPANALRGFLAQREPLNGCRSDSFNRLLQILRSWFPASGPR